MEKPLKPKLFNQSEWDFWHSLRLEEIKAIDELRESFMLGDPIMQSKALGRLKRTMMDFFAQKFLRYEGNYPRQCYSIDYSYHTRWQNGDDFSIDTELKEIEARPPIQISGVLNA